MRGMFFSGQILGSPSVLSRYAACQYTERLENRQLYSICWATASTVMGSKDHDQAAGYSWTCSHLMYVALHEVTRCTVVWYTQNVPNRQQFHVAPAMSALLSTPLWWILNNMLWKASHSCRITREHSESALYKSAVSLRYIRAININIFPRAGLKESQSVLCLWFLLAITPKMWNWTQFVPDTDSLLNNYEHIFPRAIIRSPGVLSLTLTVWWTIMSTFSPGQLSGVPECCLWHWQSGEQLAHFPQGNYQESRSAVTDTDSLVNNYEHIFPRAIIRSPGVLSLTLTVWWTIMSTFSPGQLSGVPECCLWHWQLLQPHPNFKLDPLHAWPRELLFHVTLRDWSTLPGERTFDQNLVGRDNFAVVSHFTRWILFVVKLT